MRRAQRHWARPPSVLCALVCTAAVLSGLTGTPAGAAPGNAGPTAQLADLVNPFVGTGSGGPVVGTVDTFPGADVPFGMVQWSPDTAPSRPQGGGYAYTANQVTGFSLAHLSGAGCSVFGDVPVLPTTGAVPADPETATEPFSHSTESASPGRYQVAVGTPATDVALSVTTRTGLGQFTFPPSSEANLLFKVSDSASGIHASSVRTVGTDEIEGTVQSGYFCNTLENYHLHFVAVFDRPFVSHGTWRQSGLTPGSSSCSGTFQDNCGAWVTFDTTSTPTVTMKVGVSYVSTANARANLAAEDPGWDLAKVEGEATQRWDAALGRIEVDGGTPAERTTFYTALYHCLLDPSTFSDANGEYEGFDGRVHHTNGGVQYANFSEWDIYRSEIPLLSMIDPSAVSGMVQSLLNDASQGGWLPVWEIADGDAGTMNGDSADPIIAAAYAFGVRGFDAQTALTDMLKGAEQSGTGATQVSERPNLGVYEKDGFVPADDTNSEAVTETIGASETLEYAIDDGSIAQMARSLGDASAEHTMDRRSQNWQNLFDPTTGYVQARRADGSFPPGPAMQYLSEVTQFDGIFQAGFAEGNAVQYTWSVPQNLGGLFALMGGDKAATSDLLRFFTSTNAGPWQPYDWSGNEPDLWVPWEFDYSGAPSDAQAAVRAIATTDFSNTPGGEPGNDDLGAMSSWYVWAALGLYPLTPGTANLVVASPLFPQATVHLGGSKVLRIEASGTPDTYVASAALALGRHTAQPLSRPWVPAALVEDGGTVRFVLASSPNQRWGSAPADAPPSYPDGAAPAVGFTEPSGEVTVAPGASASVEVGAQSDSARATTVEWTVTAPSGVRVSPSSGSLTLPAESASGAYGRATSGFVVEAHRSGTFDVHVTFSVPGGGASVPPVTLVVDARQS